jgi:hypothetical protein
LRWPPQADIRANMLISSDILVCYAPTVAPRTGAWIETNNGHCPRCRAASPFVRLLAIRRYQPFVEEIGRHEAAPTPERVPEGRFHRHGLAHGIDAARADRLVLRPKRDQTPTQQVERTAAVLIETHNGQTLGRGAVVHRCRIRDRIDQLEQHADVMERGFLNDASAHP